MATERIEDYLKALDSTIEQRGYAQVKDVSRILGVRPPSVTEMFQKLSKAGYINYKKRHGVTLRAKGKIIAKKTKKKHNTLKDFLLILGVNEKVADGDACRIEHVVSPETMDKLTKFVEFVQLFKYRPIWLNHFKYFYKTGGYIECALGNSTNCPIQGNNTNYKK